MAMRVTSGGGTPHVPIQQVRLELPVKGLAGKVVPPVPGNVEHVGPGVEVSCEEEEAPGFDVAHAEAVVAHPRAGDGAGLAAYGEDWDADLGAVEEGVVEFVVEVEVCVGGVVLWVVRGQTAGLPASLAVEIQRLGEGAGQGVVPDLVAQLGGEAWEKGQCGGRHDGTGGIGMGVAEGGEKMKIGEGGCRRDQQQMDPKESISKAWRTTW